MSLCFFGVKFSKILRGLLIKERCDRLRFFGGGGGGGEVKRGDVSISEGDDTLEDTMSESST